MSKLLVIDDKPDNLVVVKAICRNLMPELKIITALSGNAGIELARKEQPDVILLDIIMPGLDGYEVCRLLKADSELSIIPIILLTAIMTGSHARVKGLELGADAFLNKPINEEELIAQIKVMLRIKLAEDTLRQEKQSLEEIVTERTATLRRSEQKFKALYDNAPLSYQSLDEEGRFLDVNPTWLSTLGYAREAVIGKNYADFLHPDWKPQFEKNFPLFKQRGYVHDAHFRIQHHDGHYLDISFEGCIGLSADGSFKQTFCVFQDITLRKMAMEKLAGSERDYRGLFNNAHDAIILFRPKNEIVVEANQRAFDLYGYTREEFIGMSLSTISTDIALGTKRIKEVHKNGKIEQFEIAQKCRDGSLIHVEINASHVDYHGEEIILSLNHDITARKRAEAALKESEDHYRKVVQDQTEFIIRYFPDGRRSFVNSSYCSAFNVSEKESLRGNLFDSLPAKEVSRLKRKIASLSPENPVAIDEHSLKDMDGREIWHYWADRGIFDEKGELKEIQAVGRDITKRVLAEQTTRENAEKFRALFEQGGGYNMILDPNTEDGIPIIREANKAAIEMHGFSRDEFIGKPVSDIDDDEGKRLVRERTAVIMKGDPFYTENTRVRKDGSTFDVAVNAQRIDIGNNPPLIFTTEYDITDRKEAEVQIKDALRKAENANEVKDQFVANISHEIRTPLNSILGFSDLFKLRYVDMVREKDQVIFDYISESSTRLMHTVDSILNISMLTAGTIGVHKETINLEHLVSITVNNLKLAAEKKNLSIKVISTDMQMEVFADKNCISSAIVNLTDNAIKYTIEGGIELKLANIRGHATLAISDTGIGISDDYKQRIYEPYTQESEGFTKNFQGVGLGLALTKRYLELNDVELKLDSKKDVGSTFTLIFPKYEGTHSEKR